MAEKIKFKIVPILFFIFLALSFDFPLELSIALAEDDSMTCIDCHGPEEGLVSPPEKLKLSIHDGFSCTDCHEGVSMDHLDIEGEIQKVDCSLCHDEEASLYQKHGRLKVGTDADMPSCWSCHGSHDILSVSDPQSKVHPANLPNTCRNCHTNVNLVKKHAVLRGEPIELYENSVHGQAVQKGEYKAAECNHCHSANTPDGKPTAHRILSATEPESPIYHFAIPNTCGQCHQEVTEQYWQGIHGQLVKQGSLDSPVCTHCHGEHGIISPHDPRSPVSPARLAEQTCTPCHASEILNDKYGIPGVKRIDSYHGLKTKAGDSTVANCASCHGAHRILPSTDPTSSIHQGNLMKTCGECHPGIASELAQTKIHEIGSGIYQGWPKFFQKLYILMIIFSIGLMLLHNFADWFRFFKAMGKKPYVQRLTYNEVAQHWVLMVSFTVLVISGFSLRFAEAWWVRFLFGWEGGFEMRGLIHRIAAVVMTVGTVWHLIYLFSERGRQCLKDMMLRKSDAADIWHNIKYFLGLKPQGPNFSRFSYMEKFEYWALVWGTLLMTATGLLLWFEDFFSAALGLPKVFLDIALVIHYYEAWLAFLAILVWHIYGTVLKPGVYPMSPAWLTGKMPEGMYHHEHPKGPKLEAKTTSPKQKAKKSSKEKPKEDSAKDKPE